MNANFSPIDFNPNDLRQGVDPGIDTSITWFFTTKENRSLLVGDWKSSADDLWEGEAGDNISFEMTREDSSHADVSELYRLTVIQTVPLGDDYDVELEGYSFVDTVEDGYKMAEQIYRALKRGL